MRKLSFFIAIIITASVAFAQKVDKSQVPRAVKTMLFTKTGDTLLPTWEKAGEIYKASFIKGELKADIDIRQTGEWIKTVWSVPYKYVPQKIKDNVIANYPAYKVMKSSIQYRADGDYYVIEAKKKKDVKVLLFSLKGEFVKIDSDLISPVPIPKP
jgi:hypothetical protein